MVEWFKSRGVLVNKILQLSKRVKQLEDEKADALSDYNMLHRELLEKTSALELAEKQLNIQKNLLSVSEAFRDKEHAELEAARKEIAAIKTNKWSHLPKSPKWDFRGGGGNEA